MPHVAPLYGTVRRSATNPTRDDFIPLGLMIDFPAEAAFNDVRFF
jgi:hypothetical protein